MTIEPSEKPFYKNWLKWVELAPIFILVAFMLYEVAVQAPKAQTAQAELETEFSSITPFPIARQVDYGSSNKLGLALVTASYLTPADFTKILKHYDQELQKHHWEFASTNGVRDGARDLGSKSAYYCKGRYTAHLQYAGEQANDDWTYAFSVSWGLAPDCQSKAQGGFIKQDVPTSLFLMGFGACFTILTVYSAHNAWTKSPEEYLHWLRQQRKSNWAYFWSSITPRSYLVWSERIGSIFGVAIGLLTTSLGALSLLRSILDV